MNKIIGKTKKMAVIAGGWHFPLHFYETISTQDIPLGWEVDLFCLGHRNPENAESEKNEIWNSANDNKGLSELDRILYREIATRENLEKLGWRYSLQPNTGGDYEFLNQWLSLYDYNEYDIICAPHDDNFILNRHFFWDVLTDRADLYQKEPNKGATTIPALSREWILLINATAPQYYHIRCTMDFIKKEFFDIVGGRFDSSRIKLDRTGMVDTPREHGALSDWNRWEDIMIEIIDKNSLHDRVKYLSPYYRVSRYCIEAERGLINSAVWGEKSFREGINYLIDFNIIRLKNFVD